MVAEPAAKKMLVAHMVDPAEEAARAAISAVLYKKKTKSEAGRKGSQITGVKKPDPKPEEEHTSEVKNTQVADTRLQKDKVGPSTLVDKLDNFLANEQGVLSQELHGRSILTSPLTIGQSSVSEGFPFPGQGCIFPVRRAADTTEEVEVNLRTAMTSLNTLASSTFNLSRIAQQAQGSASLNA